MRCNLAIDQPTEHRSRAVGGVRNQPLGMKIELVLHPVQHCACRANLGLPDRPAGFDIDDDTVIGIDEVIVGIGKECRAFARCRPLARWV